MLSEKARHGFFESKGDSKGDSKRECAIPLPSQVTKRLVDGKLVSTELAQKIKATIQTIYTAAEKKILAENPGVDAKDAKIQAQINQAKFRYYGKKELAEVMQKDKSEIPYGVDFFEAKIKNETRELYCFKLPGIHGRKADVFTMVKDDFLELEQDIFGLGFHGKVIPLVNIDNPAEVFAVKIKPKGEDKEYEHAAAANLAIGRCIRQSTSHPELQERIYMHYVPGRKLGNFLGDHFFDLTMLQRIIIYRNAAVAIKKSSHQFGMVHRDIRGDNFHIDEETYECILLDYAFQHPINEGYPNFQGPPHYWAPEIIKEDQNQLIKKNVDVIRSLYTQQSDLFSFGVVLAVSLELIPRHFIDLSPEELVKQGGVRLKDEMETEDFIECCPHFLGRAYLYRFIQWLMDEDPAARPQSIDACITYFDTLASFVRAEKWSFDEDLHCQSLKKQLSDLNDNYLALKKTSQKFTSP